MRWAIASALPADWARGLRDRCAAAGDAILDGREWREVPHVA